MVWWLKPSNSGGCPRRHPSKHSSFVRVQTLSGPKMCGSIEAPLALTTECQTIGASMDPHIPSPESVCTRTTLESLTRCLGGHTRRRDASTAKPHLWQVARIQRHRAPPPSRNMTCMLHGCPKSHEGRRACSVEVAPTLACPSGGAHATSLTRLPRVALGRVPNHVVVVAPTAVAHSCTAV